MNIDLNNRFVKTVLCLIQHYNHEKYWKMRKEVVDPNSKKSKIKRLYYLFRIKKMDAFHNASMGTDLGDGAEFTSPPILVHGLNSIIVGHSARIGKNVTISQQVSILQGPRGTHVEIGDDVILGAGCIVLGGVKIGNSSIVGAGAVVTHDMPSNSVIVGVPARVIKTINHVDSCDVTSDWFIQ